MTRSPKPPKSKDLADIVREWNASNSTIPILALLESLLKNGHSAASIKDLAAAIPVKDGSSIFSRFTTHLRHTVTEVSQVLVFAQHICVTTAIFLLISMAAVALEIYLHILDKAEYASESLTFCLTAAKYVILTFDMAWLVYRLAHSSWEYARSFKWK